MNYKSYATVGGTIFLLIAIGHVLRLYFGWNVQVGTATIPLSLSWAAVILGGYLAWQGLSIKK